MEEQRCEELLSVYKDEFNLCLYHKVVLIIVYVTFYGNLYVFQVQKLKLGFLQILQPQCKILFFHVN